MTNGLLKTFADSFISFGGIIFIPADFLISTFLKSCSASQLETFGRWLFTAPQFFDMLFSFIVLILSCLANDLQIISNYFPCNGWFSSAKAFYDIYVVVIETENSYITSVTIFSQHNSCILTKPFVCKKWFNQFPQVFIRLDTFFRHIIKTSLNCFLSSIVEIISFFFI